MNFCGKTINLLLVAGLASSFALAADPFRNSLRDGLFKRAEADAKDHSQSHHQKLEALVDGNGFQIRDVRDGSQFVFKVLSAIPGAQGSGPKAIGNEFAEDGLTLLAPVDLTGSGVTDLIYARQEWGGWKVLSNGTRLPKPFDGFVCGNFEKNQESAKSDTIPADTHDLVVDNDLLAATGDFLGNGTEQLAYTRPGWTQIWVVGAHGAIQMSAELGGMKPNGGGDRVHWLFPLKSKGVQHTKLAYYRKGCTELLTFAVRGMAFKREMAPLKGNWEKLCQNVLDWPQPAPSQLEQKADQLGQKAADIKGDIAKAVGLD